MDETEPDNLEALKTSRPHELLDILPVLTGIGILLKMLLKCGAVNVAAGLLLSVATTQPAVAADRDALNGWGPFDFSMSLAQAKAAVGSKGIINSAGNMNYETTVNGHPFDASISFQGAGDRIQWIELRHEGIANFSMPECHAEREALQHNLSQVYGDSDTAAAEKDESILYARSVTSTFTFKDGASIKFYERWGINAKARERCVISILYKPGATRASEHF